MAEYTEDQLLDASGLLCPMPVVKAAKVMRGMEEGENPQDRRHGPGSDRGLPGVG